MTIRKLLLESDDTAAAGLLHKALGVSHHIQVFPATNPGEGFRGFTLSLVCAQPGDVSALLDAAVAAGARVLKPAAKSFWGFGGVIQSPDGTVWKLASSSKKDTRPADATYDDLVLLLGVADVKVSKAFYVEHGLKVTKSFGGKYAELRSAPVKLALYPRKAAAKDAGVDPAGSGSHGITMVNTAGSFTDPDGFVWEDRG